MSLSQRLSIQRLRGNCIDRQTASSGLDRVASHHPSPRDLAATTPLAVQHQRDSQCRRHQQRRIYGGSGSPDRY